MLGTYQSLTCAYLTVARFSLELEDPRGEIGKARNAPG